MLTPLKEFLRAIPWTCPPGEAALDRDQKNKTQCLLEVIFRWASCVPKFPIVTAWILLLSPIISKLLIMILWGEVEKPLLTLTIGQEVFPKWSTKARFAALSTKLLASKTHHLRSTTLTTKFISGEMQWLLTPCYPRIFKILHHLFTHPSLNDILQDSDSLMTKTK